MNYPSSFKRNISTYQGFRLSLLVGWALILVSLVPVTYRANCLPSLSELVTQDWREYIAFYWISNTYLAIFLAVAFFSVFLLHVLRGQFHRLIPPFPPHPTDRKNRSVLRLLIKIAAVCVILLTIVVIPILHLSIPMWQRLVPVALGLGSVFLTYWAFIFPLEPAAVNRGLSRLKFRGKRSFDSASLGGTAAQVSHEMEQYERICNPPVSTASINFLADGERSCLWPGYQQFFRSLSRFLEVQPQRVLLHTSTTKAVRRALDFARMHSKRIVSTDFEYPSIIEAVDQTFRSDVDRLMIGKRTLERTLTHDAMIAEIVERVSKGVKETGGPVTVLISHVYYLSGTVVSVEKLRTCLDNAGHENTILIVDGAQAIGNVALTSSIFDACHVYATSGHKWMLGKPSLGITIHSDIRFGKMQNADPTILCEQSRPFSTHDFEVRKDYKKESISLLPTISLNAMLGDLNEVGMARIAEHNRQLADLFAKWVSMGRIAGLEILTSPIESGIICASVRNPQAVREALESQFDIVIQAIPFQNQSGGSAETSTYLRFCFHYYMSKRDVCDLIWSLEEVL